MVSVQSLDGYDESHFGIMRKYNLNDSRWVYEIKKVKNFHEEFDSTRIKMPRRTRHAHVLRDFAVCSPGLRVLRAYTYSFFQ